MKSTCYNKKRFARLQLLTLECNQFKELREEITTDATSLKIRITCSLYSRQQAAILVEIQAVNTLKLGQSSSAACLFMAIVLSEC
jgi:hypothetical protein